MLLSLCQTSVKRITWIKTNRALCNHSIIYSRKGAKIILDNISHPLQMPIDHIIANLSLSNNLDVSWINEFVYFDFKKWIFNKLFSLSI